MKAIDKNTGKVYDIINVRVSNDDDYLDLFYEDVEIIQDSSTDWNSLRNQAAIAAMQGLLHDTEHLKDLAVNHNKKKYSPQEYIALLSVTYANELIEKLKQHKL